MLLPDVGLAADVNITSNSATQVSLDSFVGTTAEVAPGVVVDPGFGSRAIYATTGPWAVTNRGSLAASGLATVELRGAGSSVINYGSISSPNSNGVVLFNGGAVDNKVGATISAVGSGSAISIGHTAGPGPGTVTNAGTLSSSAGTVILAYGGSVTNLLGASITTTGNGSTAVTVRIGDSRFVSNSGTISSTGTGTATGVAVQTGASTVINTSTGSITGTFNGIYGASDAALTLTNDGTIASTGANATAYAVEADGTGSTITNAGTISSVGSSGIYLRSAGSIVNRGIITGAVHAIQFNTTNFNRTLTLDTGSVLNGDVLGSSGTGVDALIFSGTGTESAARFLAFETASMQGTAWTLTGNGSFSSGPDVQSGVLTVGGNLASPNFSILSGATVTGTGTLTGAVADGGKIRVDAGNVFTIAGSLTTGAGSSFEVGVTPTQAGNLAVIGTATLDGGTVRVLAANGSYLPQTIYTILSTTGGRSGNFDSVSSDLAFLAPTLSYDAQNVYLQLDRNLASFASAGTTRNQRATGEGLDTLPVSDPLVTPLVQLDLADAAIALDQLSGEVYAATEGARAEASRFPRQGALDRIDAAFAAIDNGRYGHVNYWTAGFGSAGTIESDGNAARVKSATGGLLLGVDGLIAGKLLVGIFGGYSRTDLTIADRASAAGIDHYQFGITAATDGDLRLKLGAIAGIDAIAVDRSPSFTGFTDTNHADFSAASGQLFGELSYAAHAGGTTLRPFAGLALVGIDGGRYAESGGAAALAGHGDDYGLALVTLGLDASTDIPLGDGRAVAARGRLALQHGSGSAPTATHHFDQGGDFTIAGAPTSGTAALLQAGLSTDLGPATVELDYAGRLGQAGQAHGVTFTLSGKF